MSPRTMEKELEKADSWRRTLEEREEASSRQAPRSTTASSSSSQEATAHESNQGAEVQKMRLTYQREAIRRTRLALNHTDSEPGTTAAYVSLYTDAKGPGVSSSWAVEREDKTLTCLPDLVIRGAVNVGGTEITAGHYTTIKLEARTLVAITRQTAWTVYTVRVMRQEDNGGREW